MELSTFTALLSRDVGVRILQFLNPVYDMKNLSLAVPETRPYIEDYWKRKKQRLCRNCFRTTTFLFFGGEENWEEWKTKIGGEGGGGGGATEERTTGTEQPERPELQELKNEELEANIYNCALPCMNVEHWDKRDPWLFKEGRWVYGTSHIMNFEECRSVEPGFPDPDRLRTVRVRHYPGMTLAALGIKMCFDTYKDENNKTRYRYKPQAETCRERYEGTYQDMLRRNPEYLPNLDTFVMPDPAWTTLNDMKPVCFFEGTVTALVLPNGAWHPENIWDPSHPDRYDPYSWVSTMDKSKNSVGHAMRSAKFLYMRVCKPAYWTATARIYVEDQYYLFQSIQPGNWEVVSVFYLFVDKTASQWFDEFVKKFYEYYVRLEVGKKRKSKLYVFIENYKSCHEARYNLWFNVLKSEKSIRLEFV